MKRFLLILTSAFLLSSAVAGSRNGVWWEELDNSQKRAWVVGWMDGTAAGARILGGIQGTPESIAYQLAVNKIGGITSEQIVQGIDQFYAADFRNLSVPATDAALLANMYAKGLSPAEASKLAADLLALYR